MSFRTFLIVVVVVGLAFLGGLNVLRSLFNPITHGEEIGMCQPTGIFLWKDRYCSETNINNSVANVNNGQSHLLNAQATLTVGENERANNQQFTSGKLAGLILGVPFGVCGGIVALVLGFWLVVRLFSIDTSGPVRPL